MNLKCIPKNTFDGFNFSQWLGNLNNTVSFLKFSNRSMSWIIVDNIFFLKYRGLYMLEYKYSIWFDKPSILYSLLPKVIWRICGMDWDRGKDIVPRKGRSIDKVITNFEAMSITAWGGLTKFCYKILQTYFNGG